MTTMFKSGLFNVTMTDEEVKQMYEDIQFLEEAMLVVLNPDLPSDLSFNYEQAVTYLKEYFENHKGYSQEFIKSVFENQTQK